MRVQPNIVSMMTDQQKASATSYLGSPHVHQAYRHQNRAPHNLPQLAEILSDHGYFTGVSGHYEQKRNLG